MEGATAANFSDFKKITTNFSGNITKNVAKYLRHLILTHKLQSGEGFPREDLFCVELGVGRSSLREAYKILELEGLITRTKRGTYINEKSKFISFSPPTTIKLSDINDLIEFRAMVEVELAGLAAERATNKQIENLQRLLASMFSHQDDLTMLSYYDMQFHIEIGHASHNSLLINTMHSVLNTLAKGIYNAFHVDTKTNVQQALQYHENILFSIQQKDKAMARNIMRSHIQSAAEHMKRIPLDIQS